MLKYKAKSKMRLLTLIVLGLFLSQIGFAQDERAGDLPYYQIPDFPEKFHGGNAIARMVDGLGYRFFWATESLNEQDVIYKPTEDTRNIKETLEHIYSLSRTSLNAAKGVANIRPLPEEELTWKQMRDKTLHNIKEASELFKKMEGDEIQNAKVIFQRGENKSEFPVWTLLNGPLADAIYHTGQIVLLRRAAGNPVDPNMNVFLGKTGRN